MNNQKRNVCFAGQMRSGKNLAGDYVCKKYGLTQVSFAAPVKQIFCEAFGADLAFVEKWKVITDPPEEYLKNVRFALQFIGDGFRQIKPLIWVDYAKKHNPQGSCYTDGRYINELKMIRETGGINILLYRPGFANNDPNGSETVMRELVAYFNKKKMDENPTWWRRLTRCWEKEVLPPFGHEYVDYFIVNDCTEQDLYNKIDKCLEEK